jgi:ATP-dependent Clp protease ATP-binding subunit ClpA
MAKFVTDARNVVKTAREIAAELDSPTLEAEHLLLAAARAPGLAAAGLDYDQVHDALADEFEASLAAVGVSLLDFDLAATPDRSRSPRWGASAKVALERSSKIADARHDRRVLPAHIVLGVLRAPAGTVPRALRRAGIDPAELGDRVAAVI